MVDIVACALIGLAVVLAASPFALYWLIHGDDERYVWLISGPAPFDQFGSGPYQLWLGVGLLAGSIVCLICGLSLRLRLLGLRGGFPWLELVLGLPALLLFAAAVSLLAT